MKRILVTGATRNIGLEVIRYLLALKSGNETIAAVRDIDKARKRLPDSPSLLLKRFDFEDNSTFNEAFSGIDILFLLRPPHISEVEKHFRPLLTSAKESGIKKVVFLSVQGAETSKVIPHNKIEGLIRELEFNYIFVRPSYFMQNLTTTLLPEIVNEKCITLPSGNAKFNWIDVKNIGEASASLIEHFDKYQNSAYIITGSENKDFAEVVELISKVTSEVVRFKSVNPISFFIRKKNEGLTAGFAVVMTILHFLPRFQNEPDITDHYKMLTGKPPTSLLEFIKREKGILMPNK